MTYKLEIPSQSDKEKILKDAEFSSDIKHRLDGGRYLSLVEFHWAVNENKDAYLFWAPPTNRDGGPSTFYYVFFYKDAWYEVHTNNILGHEIAFDEENPPPYGPVLPDGPALKELQNEIIAAFAAFGRFGKLNEAGQLKYPVHASFKERK